ncbi:hypothetical protein C7475_106337 [Chitinophaga sp. S165]|nr:hypothetical protein C7475_106337 [Chitinophaga sp. S165]
MTRLLINFFLSLCFFLLKGHGHLYADTDQDNLYKSLKLHSENRVQIKVFELPSLQPLISNAPSSGKKKEKIKATEVEEEESFSARKHLQISHYFCLSPQEPPSNYSYLKNPLPFCNHFSYSSSDKFIVHRVIRV